MGCSFAGLADSQLAKDAALQVPSKSRPLPKPRLVGRSSSILYEDLHSLIAPIAAVASVFVL
jgi:hypothetical protein